MSGLDDDVVREYLAECREHLAGIEGDLLAIEERGADLDEERVNKVFRAAHSIKGGAGFFDLNNIRELAHKIENVLDLIRSQRAEPTSDVVSVLLLAFDKLRDLIGNPAESEQADITEFVAMLEKLAASKLPPRQKSSVRKKTAVSTPARQTCLAATTFDLDAAKKGGKTIYLLEYDLLSDIQRKGKRPLDVVKELMRYGEILDTAFDLDSIPSLEKHASNRLGLDVLYATALGPELIGSVVEIPASRVWTVARTGACQPIPEGMRWSEDSAPATPPAESRPPELATPLPEPPAVPEEHAWSDAGAASLPVKAPAAKAAEAQPAADATVRLNVTLLDSLMNLAGELVLGRNQLSDALARKDQTMIQAASQRISLVTSDVQEAVMRTRMQPLGNLFQKFPRLVRDTARKLAKEVRLVEEGADVELDKTIIEGLSDPLIHMVRNAIDHGIEKADVRASHGKPATGTLSLKAWHEAGLVVVEVADDGGGLDAAKIVHAAVKKGLIPPETAGALAEQEKLALIFLPGLSTAERLTDVSGRGVGLDVVKTNLDRLGGKVEIHSETGKGTAFRIKLPLTLAIVPSLLVAAGHDRLAIPLVNVQELVRIPAAEISKRIDRVGSADVLILRDGVVPLVDLSRVLDLPEAPSGGPAAMNVVILSAGSFRYGLVVEGLHDTVEIVVKPLGRHLKHLSEYAGATILGDGCVALILDVAGLAGVSGLTARDGSVPAGESAGAAPEELHHLLLFQNSAAEACALPLHAVSRVVKIQPEQVELVGGRRTMQYRGRSLPLVMLADAAQVEPVRLDQNSIVVVAETGGRECGLLGARPVDVVEAALDIDAFTLRQRGVMGSAIIRERTTLVLDAFELTEAAWPGWNTDSKQTAPPEIRGERVLIAEDSDFFREQVVKLLRAEGYGVLEAPDGEAAWEILEQRGPEVSLVITDLEMPRLDGLQLTRRIRGDARVSHLPVIILTSLAGEEDFQRGRAAGANSYCIKLDRDQLLSMIRDLLSGGTAAPAADTAASELAGLSRHLLDASSQGALPLPAVPATEGETS